MQSRTRSGWPSTSRRWDLYPWNYWSDHKAQLRTEEIVATLETALRLDSKPPGANPLYIHIVEASATRRLNCPGRPTRAVKWAVAFSR